MKEGTQCDLLCPLSLRNACVVWYVVSACMLVSKKTKQNKTFFFHFYNILEKIKKMVGVAIGGEVIKNMGKEKNEGCMRK